MRKSTKFLSALAVAGMISASGSAFTAANTVNPSAAGAGTTAVSPYTTSDIKYNANSGNPENLDSVTFTLDKTARYVALRTKSGGTWYRSDDNRLGNNAATPPTTVHSCTSASGLGVTWTCDVTNNSETVVGANSLTIVATT